ncbi:hypothetical protein OG417_33965 [Actinoallomurus sp. NBC_01490]|uniref:hypothetical protein n=1 Tax=Actinoallomurus sp. NBC_01490 TaxID=2903557 RepID=UPI002E308DCB|nr:hypothetical protein [Actinoallomurus sp. NBC_01490]
MAGGKLVDAESGILAKALPYLREAAQDVRRPDALRGREFTVVDSSGYVATDREFAFSGISRKQLEDMKELRAPLGTWPEQWRAAVTELRQALKDEGITDADMRLKGTSAKFYSGDPAKRFPQTEDELRSMAAEAHRLISGSHRLPRIEDVVAAYRQAGFATDGPKPAVAFFDSRYKLGLSKWPSDYDFQLCSDTLAERFEAYWRANRTLGLYTKGDWYNPYLLDRVAPGLDRWVGRWEKTWGRWVSIATYGRPYLGRTTRPGDWVVIQ